MHPIVQMFVETDLKMVDIVQKSADLQQPFEKVFAEVAVAVQRVRERPSTSNQERQKILEVIDEGIVMGHPETHLYLLFIFSAIEFAYLNVLKVQLRSYRSILMSIEIKEEPPVIQASRLQCYAMISSRESDDFMEARDLMTRSLQLLNKKHQRYRRLVRSYAFSLAFTGELNNLKESEFQLFKNQSPEVVRDFIALRMLDCIHTCNMTMAKQLVSDFETTKPSTTTSMIFSSLLDDTKPYDIEKMDQLVKAFKEKPEKDAAALIIGLILLRIAHGDLNEERYQHVIYGSERMIGEIKAMLSGDYAQVLLQYQWIKENSQGSGTNLILNRYFPLHVELALGNRGKALLLLREEIQTRGRHYLDDLFYGRLYLLNQEYDKADHAFRQLMANITRYQAMGRLIYELQFVKEMSLSDILKLTQGWNTYHRVSSAIQKPFAPEIIVPSKSKLLIGHSHAIMTVKEQISKYAKVKAPILVTGQTGTGKELVARSLHEEGGFAKEPFLAINCAALADTLLQSELFGYVAGAFTGALKERKGIFESAGKGTVFLDEFGEISPKMQATLLRVLESNEIRMLGGTKNKIIECKIVVATNVNLQQAVEENKFRSDLYFRLTRFEIKLLSLHARIEDIPELIQYFLEINPDVNGRKKALSQELQNLLMQYRWPGNIRELKNEIDRLCVLNPDKDIFDVEDFDFSRLVGWEQLKSSEKKQEEQETKQNPKEVTEKQVQETKPNTTERAEVSAQNKKAHIAELLKEKGFTVENRHEQIKSLFLEYKKLTRSQILMITKVSPTTATKDLQSLCEAGFIIKRQPTPSPRTDYYELVE